MGEFKMPSLGADMEEGTLLLWKVRPGDTVHRGDIIAEVATDKGDIEIEVFEDGVVTKLLVEAGADVPVGTVLAIIGEDTAPARPSRVKASPVARRLASERGVDLHSIAGTGTGGAITRDDVLKAAPPETKRAQPKPERVRLAIAAAMARSNREIPHYYLETHIDMKPATDWLAEQNQKLALEQRLLPVVILLKAVARSLGDVPELNGYWVDDTLKPSADVHIGLAIAIRGGGLVTPAIHDVDKKSVHEVMTALRDLIPRARVGRLRSSELSDATITVTNLGDLGVETVHGVIYPPQVALVGFGKIMEQPWAVDGMLGIRPVVSATLAGDHRATDGRRGAQFLDALNRHLQEPEVL
jgi:pyruvate dehydrogenase E2 component (dihydrolipoamide acetyltransferase)